MLTIVIALALVKITATSTTVYLDVSEPVYGLEAKDLRITTKNATVTDFYPVDDADVRIKNYNPKAAYQHFAAVITPKYKWVRQVMVYIPEGACWDESGNKNKPLTFTRKI